MKAPRHERAKRATKALKQFVVKHMKTEDVSIDQSVNEKIWERGMKNPPHHIEVTVKKEDEKVVVSLAPSVTVRGKAVKEKAAPPVKEKKPEPAEKPAVTPEAAEEAKKEAEAKAPIATEKADETAPKAPKPGQNKSPESSQGTKNQ